jgi:hypothetical protein
MNNTGAKNIGKVAWSELCKEWTENRDPWGEGGICEIRIQIYQKPQTVRPREA